MLRQQAEQSPVDSVAREQLGATVLEQCLFAPEQAAGVRAGRAGAQKVLLARVRRAVSQQAVLTEARSALARQEQLLAPERMQLQRG